VTLVVQQQNKAVEQAFNITEIILPENKKIITVIIGINVYHSREVSVNLLAVNTNNLRRKLRQKPSSKSTLFKCKTAASSLWTVWVFIHLVIIRFFWHRLHTRFLLWSKFQSSEITALQHGHLLLVFPAWFNGNVHISWSGPARR